MKISAGSLKQKSIFFNESRTSRPTKLRVRQAIFNILQHRFFSNFNTLSILDCFSGSGAFGFEAVSLGAPQVFCIEKDFKTAEFIKKNAKLLGIASKMHIYNTDILKFKTSASFNIVFLDPPYFQNLVIPTIKHLIEEKLLSSQVIIIIECHKKEFINISEILQRNDCILEISRTYGKIAIGFYIRTSWQKLKK